jgi:VWFA-related protein
LPSGASFEQRLNNARRLPIPDAAESGTIMEYLGDPIINYAEVEAMTKSTFKAISGRRICLIAILILMSGGFMLSQDAAKKGVQAGTKAETQDGTSTFSVGVDVEVVNAFVTVRNKKGAFIKDLTQEDFGLKEDGRKQSISYFSREVDMPLTIGMILDTSPSMEGAMGQLQIASRAFLKKMIRPGKDNLFLMKFRDVPSASMSFDGQIEMVQRITSSADLIEKAANLIGWNGVAGPTVQAEFQTMLGDSISMASKILMPVKGRKALIIMGDGFHIGYHQDMAISAAQEADALIYTIRIYDQNFGTAGGMGGGMGGFNPDVSAENLRMLSDKTGGAYFEYSGKKNLDEIYGQIEEELRSQYSLGYMPLKSDNKGFRKIRVDVQKPGMVVRAREGYYPRKKQ